MEDPEQGARLDWRDLLAALVIIVVVGVVAAYALLSYA